MNIMIRKDQFVSGEYYHVYSRTILNIPEFENYENANKLTQCFLLANSTESSKAFDYLRNYKNVSLRKAVDIAWRGDKLVDVVAYSIMPNHYHLLVKELTEGGISTFLRKSNISIAKYINTKQERKGSLFESNFKAKHIDSNNYLLHLSLYIHLNPLDFIDSKDWRGGNLKSWNLKKKELIKYPWSSLKSYLQDDFEDLILSGTEIITDQFRGKKDYEKFLREWSEIDLEKIRDIVLD
ncbi:transposase [Patescibacteria group bacterium]